MNLGGLVMSSSFDIREHRALVDIAYLFKIATNVGTVLQTITRKAPTVYFEVSTYELSTARLSSIRRNRPIGPRAIGVGSEIHAR